MNSLWMVALLTGASNNYVVIVANNASLDDNPALSFADDDGARYFELYSALGAEVSLFSVLDADAQRLYPEAARAARPPTQEAVLAQTRQYFTDMAATASETTFTFIYSGHGGVGPNREGYLHLLDGPLGRASFYRDIVAASPATWNHIILDACNAYFVVNKRGGQPDRSGNYRDAVQGLLATEELSSYPNTGVILAASTESETHEWSRWRAGVFSHEIRAALLGAADANSDQRVDYAETAALVEAANAAIDNPRAHLRVYVRPPPARVDLPLVDLQRFSTPTLRFERGTSAHYYLEDARGVRVADLHPSGETETTMALVGSAPFYLRTGEREARVDGERVSRLAFAPLEAASKGSVDATFRRKLFSVPYGVSFLRGMLAAHGAGTDGWSGWYGEPEPAVSLEIATSNTLETSGWITLATGAALGVAGGVLGVVARETHADYEAATDPTRAKELRQQTEREATGANILFAVAATAGAVGGSLLLADWLGEDATVTVAPNGGTVRMSAWYGTSDGKYAGVWKWSV